MPKADLIREIEALRSQVAELQSELRDKGDSAPSDESAKQVVEKEAITEEEFTDFTGLQSQLEGLFGSLDDLKKVPAMTALALFGLGVIFGRLLSK